jgi:PIN domain nuclease of toxin-antitoxin system
VTSVLAGTHAAFWCLAEPSHLSDAAKDAFFRTFTSGGVVYISSISLVEIRYLVEKGKLPQSAWEDCLSAVRDPSIALEVLPVDAAVASGIERIPRKTVPDLPDRIIAATALVHGPLLVTRDRKIRGTGVKTVW